MALFCPIKRWLIAYVVFLLYMILFLYRGQYYKHNNVSINVQQTPLEKLENWRPSNHTDHQIKSILKTLVDLKYENGDEVDLKEMEKSNRRITNVKFPLKIYIYPLSGDGDTLLKKTLDLCERNVFENPSRFFPHEYIDCSLFNLLGLSYPYETNHTLIKKVGSIEESDLAYIPYPLAMSIYLKHEPEDEKGYLGVTHRIGLSVAHELDSHLSKNLLQTSIPHFITYPYVSYRISFNRIPKEIKILTYENVAVTGSPQDAWYSNGCQDRCLIIPYVTIFDWPTYKGPNPLGVDHKMDWKQRPYHISFIGSVDRTHILVTHRMNLVSQLSYFKNLFHVFKESWTGTRNTEIYQKSQFCLQLHGDTPTRNAFYESLLMGCIPIITEKTYLVYSSLYGYILPINKITIVISNNYMGFAGVEDILEKTQNIVNSGQYLRMLKRINTIAHLLVYKSATPNFLTMFTLLSSKLSLSVPHHLTLKGKNPLFLGKKPSSIHKWINFPVAQYSNISVDICEHRFKGKIYLPVEVSSMTMVKSDHFPTLFEQNIFQRFKQEDLFTDRISDADIIFYPVNLNISKAVEMHKELFMYNKKGFLFSGHESDFNSEFHVKLTKNFLNEFNRTLIYSFLNYFRPSQTSIRTIPYSSFINEIPKERNYSKRQHLVCYLDMAVGLPIPIFEMTFRSFMLVRLKNPSDLVDCDYVLLPYNNPSRILQFAVASETIPVTFRSKGLDILPLSNFSEVVIQVPQSLKRLQTMTYDLFSLWFIRFLQSIPFEETQKRKYSLHLLRKYFNLSPIKGTEDLSSILLCDLYRFVLQ